MFAGQPAAVRVLDQHFLGDADQRVVGLEHILGRKKRLVGRDKRQIQLIGQFEEPGFGAALDVHAVALHFDIEPSRKGLGQTRCQFARGIGLSVRQQGADRALGPTAQRDETLGMRFDGLQRHAGFGRILAFHIGLADQLQKIAIAAVVLDKKHQRPVLAPISPNGKLASDDRLNPRLCGGQRKLEGSEQVVRVGDGHGGHTSGTALLGQVLDPDCALRQRIRRVHAQVNEGVGKRIGDGGVWRIGHA